MRRSAGVMLYRRRHSELDVLLVLPGGPYWEGRNLGAWQIPKGEIGAGEDVMVAARREAQEELGLELIGPMESLGKIRQKGGKLVTAFAVEQDFDCSALVSNHFEMEWPPRSGMRQRFPEVSAAQWFALEDARAAILPSQAPLLDRLVEQVG